MSGGACFGCGPGYEGLAAELAEPRERQLGSYARRPRRDGHGERRDSPSGATRAALARGAGLVAQVGEHDACPDSTPIVSSQGVVAPLKEWSFLTNHARVLLCVAHDPGIRLRDIATTLGITERTAHGIVADLANAGYVVKERDGRRNRYQIQHHLPIARGDRQSTHDRRSARPPRRNRHTQRTPPPGRARRNP